MGWRYEYDARWGLAFELVGMVIWSSMGQDE